MSLVRNLSSLVDVLNCPFKSKVLFSEDMGVKMNTYIYHVVETHVGDCVLPTSIHFNFEERR